MREILLNDQIRGNEENLYLAHMGQHSVLYKILVRIPEGKFSNCRQKHRCKSKPNIKTDFRENLWVNSLVSGQGPMLGCSEHASQPSGSTEVCCTRTTIRY